MVPGTKLKIHFGRVSYILSFRNEKGDDMDGATFWMNLWIH